jgi:hypothetical protein
VTRTAFLQPPRDRGHYPGMGDGMTRSPCSFTTYGTGKTNSEFFEQVD